MPRATLLPNKCNSVSGPGTTLKVQANGRIWPMAALPITATAVIPTPGNRAQRISQRAANSSRLSLPVRDRVAFEPTIKLRDFVLALAARRNMRHPRRPTDRGGHLSARTQPYAVALSVVRTGISRRTANACW
jgi:hypothetical protein